MQKGLHILCLITLPWVYGQNPLVRATLVNQYDEALPGITATVEGETMGITSNASGYFELLLPKGFRQGDLQLKKGKTHLQTIPLTLKDGHDIDLGTWVVQLQTQPQPLAVFDLDALELIPSGLDRDQVGSALQSRRDAFLNTAAFQFGAAFFRLRGLDNAHQEVRINGIPMNTFNTGRPLWGQWGGLNDLTNRAQHFSYGISAAPKGFGGLLATTQIQLRPSYFRAGSKVSQAFSNSNYQYRTMVSYIQPVANKNPGYALVFSRRWGRQGFVNGTLYDAWSSAFLLEHAWNTKHRSWMTAMFTPNRRGKSAPLTDEVYQLKGLQYNPYWGWQNGKLRNSRESKTALPVVVLNHRWEPKPSLSWQMNLGFTWGEQASSRLLYNGHQPTGNHLQGGGINPDPVYYQRLPSYALRDTENPDYTNAYLLEQDLRLDGQIDWAALYKANVAVSDYGIYALYDDVEKPIQTTWTIQAQKNFSERLTGQWEGYFSSGRSQFFARTKDLLGADVLWDLDPFAETLAASPNNLLAKGAPVTLGTPFIYHYAIHSQSFGGSGTLTYQGAGWDTFFGFQYRAQSYQREGFFQNGGFPDQSLGLGKPVSFQGLSLKWGVNYAMTGRHRLAFFAALEQRPPPFRNVYFNPRENHFRLPSSKLERGIHTQIGYHWQNPVLDFKLNVYYLLRDRIREISFYFADGVGGDDALFVQEVITGMAHQHLGLEASAVYQPISELKIVGVAAAGRFRYANNPQLTLATEPTTAAREAGFVNGLKAFGKTFLKGYALSVGPQRAFSLAVNYEDPAYWRLSVYGNYFSHAHLDPNPLTRSKNLYTDADGLPFADYDPEAASGLLKQERFPAWFMLNATAGKSWLIHRKYLGFFISIQNALNTHYKTGGYEQGRNANYRSLLEDQKRLMPLFAPKYWRGRGTTYFITCYFRF